MQQEKKQRRVRTAHHSISAALVEAAKATNGGADMTEAQVTALIDEVVERYADEVPQITTLLAAIDSKPLEWWLDHATARLERYIKNKYFDSATSFLTDMFSWFASFIYHEEVGQGSCIREGEPMKSLIDFAIQQRVGPKMGAALLISKHGAALGAWRDAEYPRIRALWKAHAEAEREKQRQARVGIIRYRAVECTIYKNMEQFIARVVHRRADARVKGDKGAKNSEMSFDTRRKVLGGGVLASMLWERFAVPLLTLPASELREKLIQAMPLTDEDKVLFVDVDADTIRPMLVEMIERRYCSLLAFEYEAQWTPPS